MQGVDFKNMSGSKTKKLRKEFFEKTGLNSFKEKGMFRRFKKDYEENV